MIRNDYPAPRFVRAEGGMRVAARSRRPHDSDSSNLPKPLKLPRRQGRSPVPNSVAAAFAVSESGPGIGTNTVAR